MKIYIVGIIGCAIIIASSAQPLQADSVDCEDAVQHAVEALKRQGVLNPPIPDMLKACQASTGQRINEQDPTLSLTEI